MILLLPTNEISRRCEKSTFSKKTDYRTYVTPPATPELSAVTQKIDLRCTETQFSVHIVPNCSNTRQLRVQLLNRSDNAHAVFNEQMRMARMARVICKYARELKKLWISDC